MNLVDARNCGEDVIAGIRLLPDEWVEEPPFSVAIQPGSTRPVPPTDAGGNPYGNLDIGKLHYCFGGAAARFRQRRWPARPAGRALFHDYLGIFAGFPSLPFGPAA